MDKKLDLLIIGEINPDLILTGKDILPEFGQTEKLVDGAEFTIGSSSAITACGAARLGLSVAFIGLVGDDEFGRFMLGAMKERGIDVSHETIRFWWNRFGPIFASEIRRRRIQQLRIQSPDRSMLRNFLVQQFFFELKTKSKRAANGGFGLIVLKNSLLGGKAAFPQNFLPIRHITENHV